MNYTFRVRYEQRGSHVHCRVFSGPKGSTLGKCGDLVFREEEWNEALIAFECGGFEVKREGEE